MEVKPAVAAEKDEKAGEKKEGEDKQLNPEEWKKRAEEVKERAQNPLAFTEGLLKARLYFHTLSLADKIDYYKTLAEMYKIYFNFTHLGSVQEKKDDVIEALEDAVEDWGEMELAKDTFIGLIEPEEERNKRIKEWTDSAELIFKDINDENRQFIADHVKTEPFKDFLKKMFGNVDVVEFLKDNKEMEKCRDYLKKEDEESTTFQEMIDIISGIVQGQKEGFALGTDHPTKTQSHEETLEVKLEQAKKTGEYGPVCEHLKNLSIARLKPANPQSIYDWKTAMQEFLKTERNDFVSGMLSEIQKVLEPS